MNVSGGELKYFSMQIPISNSDELPYRLHVRGCKFSRNESLSPASPREIKLREHVRRIFSADRHLSRVDLGEMSPPTAAGGRLCARKISCTKERTEILAISLACLRFIFRFAFACLRDAAIWRASKNRFCKLLFVRRNPDCYYWAREKRRVSRSRVTLSQTQLFNLQFAWRNDNSYFFARSSTHQLTDSLLLQVHTSCSRQSLFPANNIEDLAWSSRADRSEISHRKWDTHTGLQALYNTNSRHIVLLRRYKLGWIYRRFLYDL